MDDSVIPPLDELYSQLEEIREREYELSDDKLVLYVDIAERLIHKYRESILDIDGIKDVLILVHKDVKHQTAIHLSIVLKTDDKMGEMSEDLRYEVRKMIDEDLDDGIDLIIHDFWNVFWNRVSHEPHVVYVGLDRIMVYGSSGKDENGDREEVEEPKGEEE